MLEVMVKVSQWLSPVWAVAAFGLDDLVSLVGVTGGEGWRTKKADWRRKVREMLLGDFAMLLFRVKGRALCLAIGWSVGVGKCMNWIWQVSAVGPVLWWKLPKCYRYSVFITQKHLKLISSFHNSLLNLVRIEWWKQNLKTNLNKLSLHGSHHFWVMSDGNTKPQIVPEPFNSIVITSLY